MRFLSLALPSIWAFVLMASTTSAPAAPVSPEFTPALRISPICRPVRSHATLSGPYSVSRRKFSSIPTATPSAAPTLLETEIPWYAKSHGPRPWRADADDHETRAILLNYAGRRPISSPKGP
ncbi:hypothetical protein BC939DRAFT_472765 [Gamsiella multidivaricata]|uniref:uncharacterized protein n=1 Tax=Gamsiella multidivaricata TaxID=101098 RepID=UPI00221E4435|nr:uncharacterized protein BC939DRAFT_472765 [Gamsiella multidivaricata]KAI7831646.1 hypothetical protein BC939DRAFT_472765 [Gamsiella multidivaricata]